MAVVINGSGTVTGISVGGLPDDIVDAGMMADNSIDSDAYVDASIDNAHLADDAVGVAELSATGTASSSTFLRGDNAWASAGGDNTPSFFAYRDSSTQSFSDAVTTKIEFNAEVYDSDTAYDPTTNYRFTVPSGEGGKYYIHSQLQVTAGSGNIYVAYLKLYINGAFVREEMTNNGGSQHETMAHQFTSIEDLSAGDYVEMFYNGNTNPSVSTTGAVRDTYFMMFKLLL